MKQQVPAKKRRMINTPGNVTHNFLESFQNPIYEFAYYSPGKVFFSTLLPCCKIVSCVLLSSEIGTQLNFPPCAT